MQWEKQSIELMRRNKKCLEILIEKLSNPPFEMYGDEVQKIVYEHACKEDLDYLFAERETAL